MEHRDTFLLEKIIEYCNKISAVVAELNSEKGTFLSNGKDQDVCAFYCLQIGEIANTLSDVFRNSHPEMDWRGIIGLRHNIAHEYGNIDVGMLWDIVTTEIPELRSFCIQIIK